MAVLRVVSTATIARTASRRASAMTALVVPAGAVRSRVSSSVALRRPE